MSKQQKPYVKPEITIISHGPPKHKEILQHLAGDSKDQRHKNRPPPSDRSNEKT